MQDHIKKAADTADRKKWLLKNASVITEEGTVSERTDLWIEDGVIAKIVPTGTQVKMPPASGPFEEIDCSRFFISCGLPNLHVHTAMNIFKGIAEDADSDEWFNKLIFPYESRLTRNDVYLGTKLGIAEMINNGVTVFADHYFFEDAVLDAVLECGIRADLAPTLFGMAPDFDDRLSQVRSFIRDHRNDSDLVSFRAGPHADYTCPPDAIGKIADFARDEDLAVHLHVSEEAAQVKLARERYSMTPFAYLDRYGIFERPVLVAHGLWVEEEDLPYLKEDTIFAICVKTYEKLAMGKGGFFALRDKIRYGFGTDGAASSNTLNVAEQARMFALLGKFLADDAHELKTLQVWQHLMSGHEAFPFGTGKLCEGAPADLVIWDLNGPDTFPVYHPVTSILYSANSSHVRYTMVDGRFLKFDGKLMIDMEELTAEAEEARRALIARGPGKADVSYL